jgi:hypothetical protein
MQQKIGKRPGGQLDWMSLSHLWQDNKIVKNITRTYRLIAYSVPGVENQSVSFLYLGVLSSARITGKISLFGKTCTGATLNLEMRDRQGQIVSAIAPISFRQKSQQFQVSLFAENPAYLLLNAQTSDKNDLIKSCIVDINSLNVSSK